MSAELSTPISPAGLELARRLATALPADELQAALRALEPELCREHEWRLRSAQLKHEESQARRAHVLYLVGLGAGFLVSMTMLTGAVIVGVHGQPWLAAALSGPSVIALTTLFVLRRSDALATRAAAHRMPPNPGTPPV
ncbi:hypothetical protein RB614_31445 [Phytohabitans sp. ZYX-F-186]|uniref:DUF2335 domain-containing protein n=1 Tax=Phytohabitans maris TaxID=3071409 RepID=A0ABU0ZPT3_9ACTN|nr:hypothetical protein [Phytohabitans sp. ZYX-F-186]MDQ7909048.1 hypothetical protein [Phytohabitans sp. ZYX-F-186]